MSDVQPFQFAPTYPLGEEPIDFEEKREEGAAAPDLAARIGNTEWCICGHCETMTTTDECFCCQELEELNQKFGEAGRVIYCFPTTGVTNCLKCPLTPLF